MIMLFIALLTFSVGDGNAAEPGKGDYDSFCASCHGLGGAGDGAAGKSLEPKPASFESPEFWKTRDDALVTKAIKEGGPAVGKSPMMIAWGAVLDDTKIAAIVKYIKSFKKSE